MIRPLSPPTLSLHRDQVIRQYVDLSGALPTGVSLVSATVNWAERPAGRKPIDRTELFGAPEVTVNPSSVPASGGGTQGGAGWVAFTPEPGTDAKPAHYEMLLRVVLSNSETVLFSQVYDLTDWGDPEEG